MSEVKIVLKRSPLDKENGVWIDGVRVEDVQEVNVFGSACQVPQVVITLLPKILTLGLDDPDIDKVLDEKQ